MIYIKQTNIDILTSLTKTPHTPKTRTPDNTLSADTY